MNEFGELFKLLPYDIIINHIAPYTYLTKSQAHLLDIRTFTSEYIIFEDYYMTMLNENLLFNVLFNDLLRFYKNKFGFRRLKCIYYRLLLKGKNKESLIRLIWAKFSPNDRTLFINNYVFIYDEI
jgi:hypothetical protein